MTAQFLQIFVTRLDRVDAQIAIGVPDKVAVKIVTVGL